MQHITNVLVYSNRCEVVDGHIFATGDKGLPHIHLQFLYMFGESSLQGKNLECKYLLPNGQYSAETVKITGKNEVTFPIHYSCFTVNGWTTLRITLINGSNRVTLEDIIIKTKETKLGEPFSNTQVEQAITQVIEVTTTSIRAEGELIKQELKNYIQQEKKNLKGEKGEKGATGERGAVGEQGPRGYTGEKGSQGQRGEPGPQGQQGLRGEQGVQGNPGKNLEFTWKGTELGVRKEGDWSYSYKDLKGPKGDKGEPGTRGPQGERGVGVTSVTPLNNNQVRLEYGDGQSAVVEIPTVAGQQGQKGEDGKGLEFNWRGTELGVRQQGTPYYEYRNLKGPQGIQGQKGKQGPQGERGERGFKGERGLTGPTGQDGKSLEFNWSGTKLGVRQTGGEYQYTDLKGADGINTGGGGLFEPKDFTEIFKGQVDISKLNQHIPVKWKVCVITYKHRISRLKGATTPEENEYQVVIFKTKNRLKQEYKHYYRVPDAYFRIEDTTYGSAIVTGSLTATDYRDEYRVLQLVPSYSIQVTGIEVIYDK